VAEIGDFWDSERVLRENPLDADEPVKWVYLVAGGKSTVNIIQAPSFNRPHIHREHDEIIYVLKGEGQARIGERLEAVKPGSVVYIPAGAVHTLVYKEYMAALSIYAPFFDPDNPDRVFVEESSQ